MLILNLLLCLSLVYGDEAYWSKREKLLEKYNYFPGNSMTQNYIEKCFSKHLRIFKLNEISAGRERPNTFLASQLFSQAKTRIENSKVFQFIKPLPKGGNLHGHDIGMVSPTFLYNLTLRKNLYGCYDSEQNFHFRFLQHKDDDDMCHWKQVKEFRKKPEFDKWLKSKLVLTERFKHGSKTWKQLQFTVSLIKPLITYRPVCAEHFYQILKELQDDNVQYLEFRSELNDLYELNGTTYNYLETARIYKETVDRFQKNFPNFIGAKLIYAPEKPSTNATMKRYKKEVKHLRRRFGSFLAGFDLGGEEDLAMPIRSFNKTLVKISDITNLMLHAGETVWVGNKADLNLIDAVIMGSRRIGHAYSLISHPDLFKIIKKLKIAIEVCPISNQVFALTSDLTNHPAKYFLDRKLPVVIGNDYPGFWGAAGLSYDWYLVYMGMTKRNADLNFLKQMALNSLWYSAMDPHEHERALKMWNKQWQKWLTS